MIRAQRTHTHTHVINQCSNSLLKLLHISSISQKPTITVQLVPVHASETYPTLTSIAQRLIFVSVTVKKATGVGRQQNLRTGQPRNRQGRAAAADLLTAVSREREV